MFTRALSRAAASICAAALAASAAPPAHAGPVSLGAEAASAEVRRGLGWSAGRPSLALDAETALHGMNLLGRIALLRGSDLHGGAGAAADLSLGKAWDAGAFTLRAEATGHLFAGAAAPMDYGELWLGARATLGPFHAGGAVFYAPPQTAIGGDNLYLRADAGLGIPASPVSLSASLGYSSGNAADPARAARLRPAGGYADWTLGAAFTRGAFTAALDYAGTDIDGAAFPAGADRIVARARLAF